MRQRLIDVTSHMHVRMARRPAVLLYLETAYPINSSARAVMCEET